MKAQFLTNAILSYMESPIRGMEHENFESMLERVVKQILEGDISTVAVKKEQKFNGEPFSADSLAAITGTLQAFRR